MRYIIVDLEATCWENGTERGRMEIIEIGAVSMESADGDEGGEFVRFVRPVFEPTLSDFCKELTHIRQEDIDEATTFPAAFAAFRNWIGPQEFTLCSWGAYDLGQFRTDCARHQIAFPSEFERHVNLKAEFARQKKVKAMGMSGALRMMKIPLTGTHHRAIDDARNIAKLARFILPQGTSRE